MPSTPSPLPHPASTPTSRLRKRSSAARPMTSASATRGGTQILQSTPKTRLDTEKLQRGPPVSDQELEYSMGESPFAFEFQSSEHTPSTWLRRISTLSSLKSGSPALTDRPESSSLSYSNASTAPILPSSIERDSGTIPRNKLVKRSSSQRALQGSNRLYSSLRRPATSHQRSATLQQQFLSSEEQPRSSVGTASMMPNASIETPEPGEESTHIWRPFFGTRSSGTQHDYSLRKRSASGVATRTEASKAIVPGITELPTLLLATSISSGSSDDAENSRPSNISRHNRPYTPLAGHDFGIPSKPSPSHATDLDSEPRTRHSMSISDVFPSPSPLTWKMPRMGSLKRTKPFYRNSGGRRVVSAPQSHNTRSARSVRSQMTMAPRNSRDYDEESRASPSAEQTHPLKPHQPVPTLPLPPLNRLSAFEIDLPGTVPSYPSTPHLGYQSSPPNPSTQSSLSVASPLGQIVPKTRAHRFSSAPSEPGSTLVGSDNDNSRLLSGDEDETDARSETIYDSTRTGATGSSHSGLRRLPIDTIFDESAPPSIPLKSKIVALEDLLHRDTFDERDLIEHHNVVEEQDVSTPVRPTQPSKEEGSPTPMHDDSEVFPSPITSSSPTPPPPELKSTSQLTSGLDLDQDDDLWSFEDPNYKPTISKDFNEPAPEEEPRSLVAPARKPKEELFRRRESPNSSPVDQVPRSNLFEWSEHPSADKDNLRGESPRPRTVHGRQGSEMRGSRIRGYRGPSAIHLRSQSVPVPDMAGHRTHNDPSKIDAWVLGNKPASEDWDGDFEFEEASNDTPKQARASGEDIKSSGMIVPRAILERQASVHGQFGQVKELTLLVEELKRLQQQAAGLGIMDGQSSELWKEADGIINLATLDEEEQDRFPSRTPQSPSFDFDSFDEDSPSSRPQRKSGVSQQRDERLRLTDDSSESQNSSRPSQDLSGLETPPSTRPRKESSAKAKSVLETIYQQRNHNDSLLLDVPYAQKKLPFDTTSLKDLVTRAGVVTRALKEIVRRADSSPDTPETLPPTPPREPPFISKMFQQPPASPTPNKPPRATNSPKSPRSPKRQRSSNFLSGNIAGNDNEINGHMKMMTVV